MPRRLVASAVLVAALLPVGWPAPTAQADPLPYGSHLELAAATELFERLPAPRHADAAAMRAVLGNAARWLATSWWRSQRGELPRAVADADLMTPVKCERFAMAAYALSVAVKTGAYDAAATGVSVEEVVARTREIVVALARTHRTVTPDGWGGSWQSALWAALGAEAGWLLGPALSDVDRLLVARMLEHEADAVRARPMHMLRNRAGRLITPGDTGAEELAWDGMALQVAVALLPSHPRRTEWAYSQVQRMVNAFARPQDVDDARVVNGKLVKHWLAGSNAETDGLVVNHHRVHPDYSTTINENLFAAIVHPLVGSPVPAAARYNADVVYGALSTAYRPGSPGRGKGGTAYIKGSAEIYYPQGTLWGYRRQMCFAALDAQVAALALDGASPVPARVWGRLHLGAVSRMQARFADGHTFQPGEDQFWLQEEWVGMQSAMAYLTQWVAANRLIRWDNSSYATIRPTR